MQKAHKTLTETTSQSQKPGTPGGDGISGSTAFDWHDGDMAPQYSKRLRGFEGITRKGMTAAKQISGSDGPSKPGTDSSRESYRNASFDKSPYQSIIQSMLEGHLR